MSKNKTPKQKLLYLLNMFDSAWNSSSCRSGNISATITMISAVLLMYPTEDELSEIMRGIVFECRQIPMDDMMLNSLISRGLNLEM